MNPDDLIPDVFVYQSEIHHFFEGLEILNLPIDNIDEFDGSFDLSILYDHGNRVEILKSASLHATISSQLIDLDDVDDKIVVPQTDITGTDVRITVSGIVFVSVQEIHDFFDGLDALELEITNVNEFDGDFDLSVLYVEANRTVILASASLHATISDQLIQLDDTDGKIIMPSRNVEDSIDIRKLVSGTEFVAKAEIHAFFDGLNELGLDISNVSEFGGEFDLSVLYVEASRDVILASASLHATISDQLIQLDDTDGKIIMPSRNSDDNLAVRVPVDGTEYVAKAEIHAFFDGLNELGLDISNVSEFGGEFDLSVLYVEANRNVILASASLHATISDQLIQLDDTDDKIIMPSRNVEDTIDIRKLVSGTEFVAKTEIHAFFDGLNELGLDISNVSEFGGEFDLSVLYVEASRTVILASASLHATISDQLIQLDDTDGKIIMPSRNSDDDLAVRILVDGTEYVAKAEIHAFFDGLNELGLDISNVSEFGGEFDLSVLYVEASRTVILASASLHATISDQLIQLDDTDGKIIVPENASDLSHIRIAVSGTIFVLKSEVHAFFDGLEALGLDITDVSEFSGTFDMDLLYDVNVRSILLGSATLHATISDQILALDRNAKVIVPQRNIEDDRNIRIMTGSVDVRFIEYVDKDEIHDFFESIESLGLSLNVIDDFSGDISLSNYFRSVNPLTYDDNQDTLLKSSIMHATISDEILGLGDEKLHVPSLDVDSEDVRILVSGFEYVTKEEIKALINALDLLGITDIQTFDGEIELDKFYGNDNQTILLASASMHATISKQIIKLDDEDGAMIVPEFDFDGTLIRIPVDVTVFVLKAEIKALIDALEVLEITDLNDFVGTITLSYFFESANASFDQNQDILLLSASMHATISDQMLDLESDGSLIVPLQDFAGNPVQKSVDVITYIYRDEIKAIINALDVLGFTSISGMDGDFDLSLLATEASQNKVLLSASMHATISDQILSIDPTALIVPLKDVDGIEIQKNVAGTQFLYKSEIKALINALDVLGLYSLDDVTGSFDLTKLSTEAKQNTLLQSASMHATISDKIIALDDTDHVIMVPDKAFGGGDIRIVESAVEFITKAEIKALINALTVMNVTNLNTFNGTITLSYFFESLDPMYDQNQDTLLASAIMHATISDQILALGSDDSLIVPKTDILGNEIRKVVTGTAYIYSSEIKAIINALDILGINQISGMTGNFDLTKLS
ncbi:MAG: hypothetical protein PHW40_05640, partial [Candidatus Izemoplasmatales bacterium]|nr:hypothetical protein [Candidatus Izemoplasmatales bacterium]